MNIVMNKNENLNLLCRVCLTENPEQPKSLFEAHDSMPASEKVLLCTGVRMHVSDGLPEIICEHCSDELEAANGFRIKCEYSDTLLKKSYIDGVLHDAISESEEQPVGIPTLIKREILAKCEPWIKSEDDQDIGVDTLHDCYSDGSSSKLFNVEDKKVLKRQGKLLKNGKEVSLTGKSSHNAEDDASCAKPIIKENIDDGATLRTSAEKADMIEMGETKRKSKSFNCNICKKFLTSKRSLERHLTCVHSEEKNKKRDNISGYGVSRRFHCTECSYSTRRRQDLNYHSRTHTGERPYQCDVCSARFTQVGSLVRHSRTHGDAKYYACPECQKQFKHKQSCERHKLVHSAERNHVCIICNKGLKTKETLEKHTKRHLNIRNFSCDACGSTFVAKEELLNHTRKHAAVKKFECNICQFRTRLKQTLKKHMMRHTGEKKFKCELCDYAAYNAGNLRTHARRHTGEKKYRCPICDMKMIHSPSINRHMLRAHGIKYILNDHTDRRTVK